MLLTRHCEEAQPTRQSNPADTHTKGWMASSLTLLAMTKKSSGIAPAQPQPFRPG
jgi:hypothetical protein